MSGVLRAASNPERKSPEENLRTPEKTGVGRRETPDEQEVLNEARRHLNASHVLGTETSTNTHALILVTLIMLSFDGLNPVRRICTLFGADDTSSLGWCLVALLGMVALLDLPNVMYYAGRIFFNSMLSILRWLMISAPTRSSF